MTPATDCALIIGISSQDGSYLAKHLLSKGRRVHGTSRDKELANLDGLRRLGILEDVVLHSMGPSDFRQTAAVLQQVRPRYVFNLAAQSSVGLSFEQPIETIDSIMHGSMTILEAMRFLDLDARFYNASSSECFGNTETPANEQTPFRPRSPYAVGKSASYWAVANYREAYGMFACSGILFNHESPLRPKRFVTQKVVRGVVDIALGQARELRLGALDRERDWGWAPEYVIAMEAMLEADAPDDYIIATGKSEPLLRFVELCFDFANLHYGEYVRASDEFYRPSDILVSKADPSKAAKILGWSARVFLPEIVERLMCAELERRGAKLR